MKLSEYAKLLNDWDGEEVLEILAILRENHIESTPEEVRKLWSRYSEMHDCVWMSTKGFSNKELYGIIIDIARRE